MLYFRSHNVYGSTFRETTFSTHALLPKPMQNIVVYFGKTGIDICCACFLLLSTDK